MVGQSLLPAIAGLFLVSQLVVREWDSESGDQKMIHKLHQSAINTSMVSMAINGGPSIMCCIASFDFNGVTSLVPRKGPARTSSSSNVQGLMILCCDSLALGPVAAVSLLGQIRPVPTLMGVHPSCRVEFLWHSMELHSSFTHFVGPPWSLR